MKKRSIRRIFSFAVAIATCFALLIPGVVQARIFTDSGLAGPQFISYVEDLGERGIVSGVDGKFYPTNKVSRGGGNAKCVVKDTCYLNILIKKTNHGWCVKNVYHLS